MQSSSILREMFYLCVLSETSLKFRDSSSLLNKSCFSKENLGNNDE